MHYKGSVLRGSLLVAGTSVGGGMLALPVLTSVAGFLPSLAIYFLCWLFMASTGLLFLEVSQWLPRNSNLISMAENLLGKAGRYFAWLLYLFLFYCLTVAYIVGCGSIFAEWSQHSLSDRMAPILFTFLFSPLILIPTALASRLNVWLVVGLACSYMGFMALGFQYVDSSLLCEHHWAYAFRVLPIAFISFAYQGIIPTLVTFMHHEVKNVRKAILIGSSIPLVAYILWQWLIMGIVPLQGPDGLQVALKEGKNAVQSLKFFIDSEAIYGLGQGFAFFALLTSLLGVALGLRDFLADGLKVQQDLKGKLWLALLVFLPPLAIAMSYPHIFLIALDYAGGFGSALLLGLLPIVMVWRGRYHFHLNDSPQLPGGKFILLLLGFFVVAELCGELRQLVVRHCP